MKRKSFLQKKKYFAITLVLVGFSVIFFAQKLTNTNLNPFSQASELDSDSKIVVIDNFDTPSFSSNVFVIQSQSNSPLEGKSALVATFTKGGQYASLIKNITPTNMQGTYLHLDVFAHDATLNWPSSPTIKLMSEGEVVMEERLPVRVNEWTGLNFKLTNLDQAKLAKIDTIEFYVSDVINPGSVAFTLDNMYVSPYGLAKIDKPITLIFADINDGLVDHRNDLITPYTSFAMRTVDRDFSKTNYAKWEEAKINYYLTIASSDFVQHQNYDSIYAPIGSIKNNSKLKYNSGYYLHEVISYNALINNWNWSKAVSEINWRWLDQVAKNADKYNKKIVWSEPAEGWKYLLGSRKGRQFFSRWGSVVVPMFATNFHSSSSGYHMATARDYASLVAGKYNLSFGQSHQGWYFHDQNLEPTRAGSSALARLGYDHNASYFQFEGTPEDFEPNSPYLLGIIDFVKWVNQQ